MQSPPSVVCLILLSKVAETLEIRWELSLPHFLRQRNTVIKQFVMFPRENPRTKTLHMAEFHKYYIPLLIHHCCWHIVPHMAFTSQNIFLIWKLDCAFITSDNYKVLPMCWEAVGNLDCSDYDIHVHVTTS